MMTDDQPIDFGREAPAESSALAATLAPGALELRRDLVFGPARIRLVGRNQTLLVEGTGYGGKVPPSKVHLVDASGVNHSFSRYDPLVNPGFSRHERLDNLAGVDDMANSDVRSPRLFTTHGTVLYVDSSSGELRHGPRGPPSARIALDGTRGELIVPEVPGSGVPIRCRDIGTHTADRAVPTVFEVVPLNERWVALRSDGLFLSAVPDGGVSFARRVCNWENFLLADPLPVREGDIERSAVGHPSLSISCIETRPDHIGRAARAVERTAGCIRVDMLYWFSTLPYPNPLPGVDIVHIQISDFTDFIEDINRTFLHLMPQVVATDFNLIVQFDGFAVNPQAWDPLFLDYDYIGAPFCGLWGGGPYWRSPIVGNGGFSLRSRKLYGALRDLRLSWRVEDWLPHDEQLSDFGYYLPNAKGEKCLQEDVLICLWARKILETRYGIRFCPPELAGKFSLFQAHPLTQYWLGRSFGFHGTAVAAHYGVTL